MQGNCARCGRKVKSEENWLRAHLWASTAVFHWNCFIALMKQHGENGAEQATWDGDHAPATAGDANRGFGKWKRYSAYARATPDAEPTWR